jgi:hypothetical protein
LRVQTSGRGRKHPTSAPLELESIGSVIFSVLRIRERTTNAIDEPASDNTAPAFMNIA